MPSTKVRRIKPRRPVNAPNPPYHVPVGTSSEIVDTDAGSFVFWPVAECKTDVITAVAVIFPGNGVMNGDIAALLHVETDGFFCLEALSRRSAVIGIAGVKAIIVPTDDNYREIDAITVAMLVSTLQRAVNYLVANDWT